MLSQNERYNGLSRINPEMGLDQAHIIDILALIDQYGMHESLGFHLLHKHDSIPEGKIKLETKLETVPNSKWNKAVSIDTLDLTNIHGTMFKLVPKESHLIPFEFAKGPSPIGKVDEDCVKTPFDYVTKHGLTNAVALQVLELVIDGQPKECTAEVEVGPENGTVVLPQPRVKNPDLLPTGWSGAAQQPGDPDPPQPGPNETWQKQVVKDRKTHRVFISQAENEEQLVTELIAHEVMIDV